MSRNSNLVLQTHTFLIVVLQKVYRILPARKCRLHGATTASDSESDFHNWFFKPHAYGRKNFKRLVDRLVDSIVLNFLARRAIRGDGRILAPRLFAD